MQTIVVSAVNLRKGGTLTILRQCLEYLSSQTMTGEWRVVALVHRRELADYPGIEYIEIPWTVKGWGRRLWCEYVTMHRLSEQLQPVDLWLSLHDTTPRVKAKRQAVYCQTSFPFLKWKLQDLRFDPKIVLFALFTRFAYRINIHRNRYLIVQAEWLRDGFAKMFHLPKERFIVAPPSKPSMEVYEDHRTTRNDVMASVHRTNFLVVATPDCHKNFETVCEAARLLENDLGTDAFRVTLSVKGDENRYARWLKAKWGNVQSIDFAGFLPKDQLYAHYAQDDCLIFPSRVETWGLPISEFGVTGKPILLADLPYAHETAGGCSQVAFFEALSSVQLCDLMKDACNGEWNHFRPVPRKKADRGMVAEDWSHLFFLLTNNN